MATLSQARMAELLAKARANLERKRAEEAAAMLAALPPSISIDLTGTGISNEQVNAGEPAALEAAVEMVADSFETATVCTPLANSTLHQPQQLDADTPEADLSALSFGERAALVTLNEQQQRAFDLARSGASFNFVGKAGTGKTTACRRIGEGLVEAGIIKPLPCGTKWLVEGAPGILICAFTNKAVNNIRHVMPADFKRHCLTIHKVLEFAPVFYEFWNEEAQAWKKTMRFEPQRNVHNPLPPELSCIVMEETSMTGVQLNELFEAALPHPHQIIYVGDIRQLPPVFGDSIFGYKMLQLPIVELTEVYRQALQSPILRMALSIDAGEEERFAPDRYKGDDNRWHFPRLDEWRENSEHGIVNFRVYQKATTSDYALDAIIANLCKEEQLGNYDPEHDIILCPFNKAKDPNERILGTVELNRGIMQYLGTKRGAVVHEIIAGFEKHYLAVGDRVMFNKENAIITEINKNANYLGQIPQPASSAMNRSGVIDDSLVTPESKNGNDNCSDSFATELEAEKDDSLEFVLPPATNVTDRVHACSHIITVKFTEMSEDDPEHERSLETAEEVNNLLGGYAITVHKAQGSEWHTVWLALHQSHSTMVSRELLYTACTRARFRLEIFCEHNSIYKGIRSQRIKGNTLEEKLEVFRQKMAELLAAEEARKAREAREAAEMRAACEAAIRFPLEKLNKLYAGVPGKDSIAHISCEYADKGNAAGTAFLDPEHNTPTININPLYFREDREYVLKDTIPHEVAHIFAWKWFNDYGHGTAWRQLCIEAGGSGQVHHDMDRAAKIRGRKLGEGKSSSKQSKGK